MLVGVGLAFRARGEAGDRAWVICLRGRAEGDARDVYGEGRMLGPAWACFTAFTYVRATELCSLGGAPGVGTYGRRNGVCMSESYESDCVACYDR